MMRFVLPFALVACSSPTETPTPDPTGGAGGATVASSATAVTSSTSASSTSASSTGAGGATSSGSSAPGGGYESGSRLRAVYLAGADGSKLFEGFYDSQRNEKCSAEQASDGVLRCMPAGAPVSFFSDATCTNGLAVVTKGCAAPANATMNTTITSACSNGFNGVQERVFGIGGLANPAPGSTIYSGGPGACTGLTSSDIYIATFDFYTVGAEAPASSFVQLQEMIE